MKKNLLLLCIYFFSNLLGISHALETNTKPLHEWVVDSPHLAPEAYFTNLHNGDAVQSPFVVRFGMSYWGIAPAEHDLKNTGHHHLLIDTPLPIPIQSPIPFVDNKYVHFGKGQMETVLNLPVGEHTLRLLLADHKHRPYFIYSPELKIKVTAKSATSTPLGYSGNPELQIITPSHNSEVSEYFKVYMHASLLNIAHADTKVDNTGYFRLLIDHSSRPRQQVIDFKSGQTEVYFKMPKGQANLQLLYIKNPTNAVHTVKSAIHHITIK